MRKIINSFVIFAVWFLAGSCRPAVSIDPDLMQRITWLSDTIYSIGSLSEGVSPYVNEGLGLCEKLSSEVNIQDVKTDISPILAIYNNGAINIAFSEMNYEEAIRLLKKGISYSGAEKYTYYYSSMCSNIVLAYFIRMDTAGMVYARDLYNKGVKYGNAQTELMGLYSLSMMNYVSGDYEEALKCIEKVTSMDYSQMPFFGVDALHANILAACGRGDDAEIYYKAALGKIDDELPIISAYTYMSYGNYMKDNGNYAAAIDMLKKGIQKAEEVGDRMYDFMLYRSLSEACELSGKYPEALDCFKRYKKEADDVFNIERERAVSLLNLKYERARHEAVLHKRTSAIVTISIVLLAMSVIVIILVAMYRSKNRMYLKIVRQYKELLSIQEDMDRISGNTDSGVDESSGLNLQNGRLDDLFLSLENMMTVQQAFRNPGITRDNIAESLGTNRTYLSKTVNEHRKQNFTQYVNSYRIQYAVKRLSDPGTDVSLKEIAIDAGFSSFTTFARAFKGEVGMPPSIYRDKVLELDKKEA